MLTVLTVLSCLVAVGALAIGRSYPLEAFGFVTGVVCVYLAARENIWNWPIGLLNSSASIIVMFRDRLFADAALYVVYFVSGVLGWYWWLRGGEKKDPPPIRATPSKEWPIIAIAAAAAMALVGYWMYAVEGAAPLVDTFVTVMSLVAQYLLTRKYIENWVIWILVDVLYVPLFLWKGLYLYAILFAIFTVIAYFGLREWKRLRDEATSEQWPMPAKGLVHSLLALGVLAGGLMTWFCVRFESNIPPKALATLKGFDPITATVSYDAWKRGTELTPSQLIHVKANLLDPLLFKPTTVAADTKQGTAWIRFWKKDEVTGQEVEQFTYEIFADHARVAGKPVTLDAFEKIRPYLPAP